MPVSKPRHVSFARGYEIPHAERVRAEEAHGQPDARAIDHLVTELVGFCRGSRAQADDPVLTCRRLEHGAMADDQPEVEHRLRDDAVAVVPFILVADSPGRAEARAPEG